MTDHKKMFNRLISTVKNHKASITNLIIILLTVGSEEIFDVTVFACPCKHRVLYGWLFIFAPAVFLFGLGILMNNTLWRLVTGCRQMERKTCCRRTVGDTVILNLGVAIFQATLAPLVWIFIVFMDGDYFACVRSKDCDIDNPSPVLKNEDKSYSQMIGWFVVTIATVLVVCLYCIKQCCNKFTFEQQQYATIYDDEEKEILTSKAKQSAKADVERNAEKFFEEISKLSERSLSDSKSRDKLTSAWNSITILGSRGQGYTPLDNWSRCENTDGKLDSTNNDTSTDQYEISIKLETKAGGTNA